MKNTIAAPCVIAEDKQEQIEPGGGFGGGKEEQEAPVFGHWDGEIVAEVFHAHGQKGEQRDDAELQRFSLCRGRFVAGVAASPEGEEGEVCGAGQGDRIVRIGNGVLGDHAAEIAQPMERFFREVAREKEGNPREEGGDAPPVI